MSTLTWFKAGLVLAFAALALGIAFFVYAWTRDFIASYDVTQLEGIAIINRPTSTPNELGTPAPKLPLQSVSGPTPQPWDGASRVSVLVMGLDYGDWSEDREGPSRTDTMILLSFDPISRIGSILNIPRDLWVNIPGFGYGKINTAFYLGEANRLPGGGPGLAIKTVEQFLGIPINFYAQIDFFAFEQFIDEINGVLIDVPYEITIDPIGPGNTITLQPGQHRLYGSEALAYARARNSEGGDFDRAQRQQQVIMEIRRRVLKPEVLPLLISKAPILYNQLAGGIHTNMSLEEAIQFTWLAQQVPVENIRKGTISPPAHVRFAKSPDGTQDILKPVPDEIRKLRDEIFGLAEAFRPSAQDASSIDLMKAEGARIAILNGTMNEGLASRTQEYLLSQGAVSVTTGNAGEIATFTRVIDYTGKPYTLRYLVELMQVNRYGIRFQYNPGSEVDVEVILGADWANSNVLP